MVAIEVVKDSFGVKPWKVVRRESGKIGYVLGRFRSKLKAVYSMKAWAEAESKHNLVATSY
jgi:hypothetical protein